MIYNLTHDEAGRPLTRLARSVKVGFGAPRGAAVHVWIDRTGEWVVDVGVGRDVASHRFSTKEEAQRFYGQARMKAGERKYPSKLAYWTFQRVGASADLYPDWHAIEVHGPKPTEIPVVLADQNPLHQRMEWWTAAELKCEGDGRDARRRCTAARGPDQQKAAAAASANGEAWFPIVDGCGHGRCPEASGDKPVCKPHSRLSFLLAKAPSLGTTCTYDSTGYRTAIWLASPLEQLRQLTGGHLAGVTMRLKLQAYKTSFNGKPSVQLGATLYMPETDFLELVRRARQQADEFSARLIDAPAKQIAAPDAIETTAADEPRLSEPDEAALMHGEFYVDADAGEELVGIEEFEAEEDRPAFDVKPQRKSKPSLEVDPAVAASVEDTKGDNTK